MVFEKISRFFRGIAGVGSAAVLSAMISTSAIAAPNETPNKKETYCSECSSDSKSSSLSSESDKSYNKSEEGLSYEKDLEAMVSVDYPHIQVNLNDYTTEEALRLLGRSFAGGYQIKTPHTDKEYDSVDIRFVIAKDSVGKEIPFFYLEDSTGHIDRLFFSHIKKVRYGIQQMGDDFTYHVLVTSAEEVKNDNGLKGYELRFYDFPTDDKPEMAAAYVIALAKKYSDNPSGINQEDKLDLGVSECSEKKCPELKPNPHISTSIAQKICSGDLKSSNDSYNVLYVGEINYDECVYDPLQNMTMLEMTLANLPGITDTQSNVLLICGNADELSADNCPEPINEGNFMLSFYRAKSLADLIEATRQKYAESLNIVSHPMGTALNERSVKVYYITGNVYLKETQEVEK